MMNDEAKKKLEKIGNALSGVGQSLQGKSSGMKAHQGHSAQLETFSDERMKERFSTSEHLSDCLEGINAYMYKYKNQFQNVPGTNDKVNVGIMAQELERNPVTESCVIDTEEGYKAIDGGRLATTDLALISDLAKRVKKLENQMGDR